MKLVLPCRSTITRPENGKHQNSFRDDACQLSLGVKSDRRLPRERDVALRDRNERKQNAHIFNKEEQGERMLCPRPFFGETHKECEKMCSTRRESSLTTAMMFSCLFPR